MIMSDHSHVDEITGEARKFSSAITAALQVYAQSANWRERQRARKQIKRLVREEQRAQTQARAHHLTWSNQAVDRYRAHAQAVAVRANDPSVDHERRARDAASLANHRDDLAAQFVSNGHLTRTEQGIALDGLDAATVFPEFKTGDLFSRAHKVKGLEALRYRARVARETVSMQQRAQTERAAWVASLDAAARANREETELARIEAAQPDQYRYVGEMTWTDTDGGVMTESRSFPTEHVATAWMSRSIDHTLWTEGTKVAVRTADMHTGSTQYTDWGRPEVVGEKLSAREATLRERTLAGHVHREDRGADQVQAGETTTPPWATGRDAQLRETDWATTVRFHEAGREPRADDVSILRGQHADREQAAKWAEQTVADLKIAPNTTVSVVAHQGSEAVPTYIAQGTPEQVREEIGERWHRYVSNVTYLPEGANQVVHERAGHGSEIESAVWTHNQVSAIRPAPGTTVHVAAYDKDTRGNSRPVFRAEGEQEAVTDQVSQWWDSTERAAANRDWGRAPESAVTERDRLRSELDSLSTRHRLSIEHNGDLAEQNARLTQQLSALTAERDELRETNTELVNQLATTNGHTNGRDPIPGHAFAGLVNGYDREGMER
ncbi:hypothetical protein A9X06_09240 [Mycobacterium sp. 852002-51759_SCH5129042]|nr:hypothetical protein A9X06_09240 [Mycobacterium sp. 852002-51759_SCH5129042]